MVAKFLSPDREIVSRFGDCLPFGDMSLAVYTKKLSRILFPHNIKESIRNARILPTTEYKETNPIK